MDDGATCPPSRGCRVGNRRFTHGRSGALGSTPDADAAHGNRKPGAGAAAMAAMRVGRAMLSAMLATVGTAAAGGGGTTVVPRSLAAVRVGRNQVLSLPGSAATTAG